MHSLKVNALKMLFSNLKPDVLIYSVSRFCKNTSWALEDKFFFYQSVVQGFSINKGSKYTCKSPKKTEFLKCEFLKMVECCGIYLCNYPSWHIFLWNLKVQNEAKFVQINSALFPFTPILLAQISSLKVLPRRITNTSDTVINNILKNSIL